MPGGEREPQGRPHPAFSKSTGDALARSQAVDRLRRVTAKFRLAARRDRTGPPAASLARWRGSVLRSS